MFITHHSDVPSAMTVSVHGHAAARAADSTITRRPPQPPHDPMTTPNDTTPTDDPTNQTARTTDQTSTDRRNADTSPRTIPGRTPITEEAGAPIVPTTTSDDSGVDRDRHSPTPEPAADRRRAGRPLVPDLRPTRRPRTDGRSR